MGPEKLTAVAEPLEVNAGLDQAVAGEQSAWQDITFRPKVVPEVLQDIDGLFQVVFQEFNVTILLNRGQAHVLINRMAHLLDETRVVLPNEEPTNMPGTKGAVH